MQGKLIIEADGICPTLPAAMGMGGGYIPMIAWDGTETCSTITANNANGAQRMPDKENFNSVIEPRTAVRRLTPLECERLQGFPDGWTDIGEWTDTKGKVHQTTDSARYKALGNSIAVGYANRQSGFWMWLLKRISAQYERSATMASLFDGIGGFPLAWEFYNGKGSAVWASEIEEFPIAVTKRHFPEEENYERSNQPGGLVQQLGEREDA